MVLGLHLGTAIMHGPVEHTRHLRRVLQYTYVIRFGRPIISITVTIVNIRQFIQSHIICFQVSPSGVGCVWVECHRLLVLEFLVRFDRQDLELNNLCGSSNLHIRLSAQHSRKFHRADPLNLYYRFPYPVDKYLQPNTGSDGAPRSDC